MGTPKITLRDYEAAERAIAHESSTVGLMVHGIITMLVGAVLIVCDVVLASEFPWAALAVGSMLVGLLAHWWFGYIKVDDRLTRQQQMVEARAARMRQPAARGLPEGASSRRRPSDPGDGRVDD